METAFFKVFPSLQLYGDEQNLMAEATVDKMSATSAKTLIKVFVRTKKLIHKRHIFKIEKEIQKQIFFDKTKVKIIERFDIADRYTPKSMWEEYKDSVLMELENYSKVIYNIFKNSELKFLSDNELQLVVEENIIAKDRLTELRDIISNIFNIRCGFNVTVSCKWLESQEEDNEDERNSVFADEIARIIAANKERQQEVKKAEEEKIQKNQEKEKQREKQKQWVSRKLDDKDVIYGKPFEDKVVKISSIEGENSEVVIDGQIRKYDKRELRNEKTLVTFAITDFSDTIMCKIFVKNEQLPELEANLKEGSFVKVCGVAMLDKFEHEMTIGSVTGIKKSADNRVGRMDNSQNKRVELHCHTKMSDMDGICDIKTLIKLAVKWGHKALAITDHGAVQGFTEAFHIVRDMEKSYKKEGKEFDFKIIYGLEGYLVDDLKEVVSNSKGQSLDSSYVVFDLETTGFNPFTDRIIEIGAVKIENGKVVDTFSEFVNPKISIPYRITELTSITDAMVADAESIETLLPKFLKFCEGSSLVAHNADFDVSFIRAKSKQLDLEFEPTYLDTVALTRILVPTLGKYKLDTVAKHFNISLENHHRAVDDATATAYIYLKLLELLKARDVENLDEVNKLSELDVETIRKLPSHHVIMLCTSDVGRVNMYRLVSESHLTYYNRHPRIPKSELQKYREGILIGSACEAGELYQAILRGADDAEIARLVNFYDYLEIQPIGNNMFMVNSDKYSINSVEELQDINRHIIELGRKFNKPVVATCDAHFIEPEDEIYRRVIMAGKGFEDCDNQAPLYYRTTEEMLKEFDYLGEELAYEVVVENTNRIAELCNKIEPVRPDKCPPVIENSDQDLRDICYKKAHEMYGENLPPVVTDRLERELNSIISNGYSVMYIIAQKLVWKSNEDGYLVGSRGSVGSSFAATMAGITEVNPLSPHYLCPKCFYSDFDSDEVKQYAGGAGCDMPDKLCPVCGTPLKKEGFDIPFETFLGFNGDKEPDIDLNFSGEYQAKAHAYTEVIFGKGQTFKAGTIGTLADKTAYGYVKKYFEERNVFKRSCEIDRIVEGCVGIRRTTGQHPGGIIVLPHGEDIYSFTPIQHPANDMSSNIITTHFDYHSIDHNLLKLDILGHDDPTMIRMLQDLTGVDPKDIPLDSPEVMSLFKDTSALGIKPEDIGGCKLGALGIPEFGTDFAMQMLIDTKPQHFSDLVRIAGLSHGTDVWLGNAQTLLKEGKATISTAICTRDDIMIYLIGKGLDPGHAFKIMESVRKGKGLTPEWEEEMTEHGVPDWYIWSCKKIKYMFPKAHAAAYVMMAWRIAYCKVFYPLAYYSAFFSIRAKAFSYEIMCQGRDKLDYYIEDYKKRDALKELSNKEEDQLRDMRIVQEMYARGFEFMPIDLKRVKASRFQIIDGKIMPSLCAIDGLGEKAAEQIETAAKDGDFLSKDDFRQRCKVGTAISDLLENLGILSGIPESNQLSLFDMMM